MVKLYFGEELIGIYRALCDSGAVPNLLKNRIIRRHNSYTIRANSNVIGIGDEPIHIRKKVCASIQPWFEQNNEKRIDVEFWVLPKSSKWAPILPDNDIPREAIEGQLQTQMADPTFWRADEVSILLGIEIWAEIIEGNTHKLSQRLVSQESQLGNLIFGRIGEQELNEIKEQKSERKIFTVSLNELDETLKRFWHFEDLPLCAQPNSEHDFVERMFNETHYREPNGRFVVKIPMKPTITTLGSSKLKAKRRFFQLEARMERDRNFKEKYVEFMREYENLGHMIQAKDEPDENENVYYIPHHGVVSSDKFRVVFDASCLTDQNISLNSAQFIGPKLQRDLIEILMRFRRHKVAVSADIKKMFRQIGIHPEQWNLQRIFWRENKNEPLKEYYLVVVTYGLASSPYLAVKAMQTGARALKDEFPEAVNSIMNDFYMDDALTGAEDEQSAIKLAKDMQTVLAKSQLPLCKWRSNSNLLVQELSEEKIESVLLNEQGPASVLGLKWITKTDELTYVVNCAEIDKCLTKRTILSKIGQLYDPVGFLAPVIVRAKLLVQAIWKAQLEWDEIVPEHIAEQWKNIWATIKELERVKLPRWIQTIRVSKIQLHGFADSSGQAYGGGIYVRIIDENGTIYSYLIASKSRVAPIKSVTIPRLELSAAEVLSQLFVIVCKAMEWQNVEYYLWSDSTIALQWINHPVHELKIFVANRVKKIRDATNIQNWNHVRTKENPADLISRGISPKEIIGNELWWHGPVWLRQPQENWPKPLDFRAANIPPEYKLELKVLSASIAKVCLQKFQEFVDNKPVCINLIDYTNNLDKLLRIMSYVLRFCEAIKNKERKRPTNKINLKEIKELVELPTSEEKINALNYFVREEQKHSYAHEYKTLLENSNSNEQNNYNKISEQSKLKSLYPFMDENKIIRVGGRLDAANIPYDMKHPIIIPQGTRLSYLLIERAHHKTLHGSVQVMMQFIRNNFWIPRLRNEVRTHLHKCVVCVRYNKKFEEQLMAGLPEDRINRNRAFLYTGVDYAGPIEIVERYKSRTNKSKAWIAVFVCLVTRAIHLDAVTDLSSAAFIACYERFIFRRGHVNRMYSDNGTGFVGASKELKNAFKNWVTPDAIEHMNKKGTTWKFMTPAAPHQGGIYEAAVKSAKYHLQRMLGAKCYTYEYLITLLVKIEAVLNSRPMYALNDDISDYRALTPAHFLIQEPFILPPEISVPPQTIFSLKRIFEEQKKIIEHFWERWQNEYLTTLLPRKKWTQEKEHIQIGQLVIIKDENLPPSRWLMGRIIELIKSKDGLVRSVVVQTPKTKLKRAVQKICILPVVPSIEHLPNSVL